MFSMTKPNGGRHWRAALLGAVLAAMIAALAGALAPSRARAQSDVDISKIFWCKDGENGGQTADQCAEARDLILQNCTSCHTFVPIVKAQKSEQEWNATLATHRSRLPDVSDDDYAKIRAYLIPHFNPQHPKPELPPALEQLGTGLPS
jgi:hypothetical protein